MSDFLHMEEFLKTAQEEDLLAIVRPGPFICAEYEFGGFPSWLLRDEGLRVRSSESQYMKYVARYFKVLIPILAALQFINGGPIIMFQVENEYANSGIRDMEYLRELRKLMLDLGKYLPIYFLERQKPTFLAITILHFQRTRKVRTQF